MNLLTSPTDTGPDIFNCKGLWFVGVKGVEAQSSLTPHSFTYCLLCHGVPARYARTRYGDSDIHRYHALVSSMAKRRVAQASGQKASSGLPDSFHSALLFPTGVTGQFQLLREA
jgi:hypothetical protein